MENVLVSLRNAYFPFFIVTLFAYENWSKNLQIIWKSDLILSLKFYSVIVVNCLWFVPAGFVYPVHSLCLQFIILHSLVNSTSIRLLYRIAVRCFPRGLFCSYKKRPAFNSKSAFLTKQHVERTVNWLFTIYWAFIQNRTVVGSYPIYISLPLLY